MSLSPWICQVVHGAFILGIQEQSGDAAVALMDAGPLGQQVLANMKGTELPGSEKNHGLPLVNIQKMLKVRRAHPHFDGWDLQSVAPDPVCGT